MKVLAKDIEEQIVSLRFKEPTLGIKKILERLRPYYPALTAKQIRVVLQDKCLAVSQSNIKESLTSSNACLASMSDWTEVKPIVFEESAEQVGLAYIVDLPYKGKGMVAASNIPDGTLVLAEAPLLAVTAEVEQSEGVLAQVEKLGTEEKESFFSLHDKDSEIGQKKTAIGIWNTNVIELGLALQGGVFYHCSRINHSCTPNLHDTWHKAAGEIELRAVRNVEAGEELSICYTDPLASAKERKSSLMNRYAFECTCAACTTNAVTSDESRGIISKLQNRLQTEGSHEKPFRNLKEIREALALLEVEGLYGPRHEFSDPAYRIVFKLGMLEEAKVWASQLYEHGRTNFGEDDERVVEWKKWIVIPGKPTNFLEMEAVKEFLVRAGQLGLTNSTCFRLL